MNGAAQDLLVRIGADVSGLTQGLNTAETAVTRATGSVNNAIENIQRTFRTQITQINGNLRLFGDSAELSARRVGAIRTAIDQLLAQGIRPADERIQRLTATLGRLNTATTTLRGGSQRAGQSLTDITRIAQDAPFGFIAIQNNIGPLVESFGRLRTETGSNVGAFKALGQSLLGPAGVGLAIAAVSAAYIYYIQYQQKSKKATEDAKKSTEDYIKTLDQVRQAQLGGAQNAQKEVTELRTLYQITQNATLSSKQRGEAVDELQKKYPEYFKNLKDETVLNGGAKQAYDALTTSIIATARARAAQDLITKNSSRQLEDEQKVIDLQIKKQKDQIQLEKTLALAGNQRAAGSAGTGAAGGQFNANARERSEQRQAEIQKTINNLKTDSNLLTEKNLRLEQEIVKQVKTGADLTSGTEKTAKAKTPRTDPDVVTDNLAKIRAIIKANDDATFKDSLSADDKEVEAIKVKYENEIFEINKAARAALRQRNITKDQTTEILKTQSEAIQQLQNQEGEAQLVLVKRNAEKEEEIRISTNKKSNDQIAAIAKEYRQKQIELNDAGSGATGSPLKQQAIQIKDDIADLKESYKNGLTDFEDYQRKLKDLVSQDESGKRLQAQYDSFSSIVTSGIGDLAGGLGEGIAGLVSGTTTIGSVAGSLIGIVGDVAINLGKSAIAIGIGMKAIKLAFTNPFTAIAAGVALIAIGALIKNTAGIVSGGGSSGSSSSSESVSYGVPKFASGVRNFAGGVALVGESGPELLNLPTGSDVIPNSQIASFANQGGGGSSVAVTGEFFLKGSNLVAAIDRENRNRG